MRPGVEYFGEKVFARVLFFYNDIDNLIAYEQVAGGTGSRRTYIAANVESAETKGIETEVTLTLPHGLELSAGYTYLDARDTGNDERLDGKPCHTVNAKLAYRQPVMGFSAVLRAQHIADQVLYNDDDELEDAPIILSGMLP